MIGTLALMAATALGVDPGWEKLEGGGWRYHIQVDPENLKALMNGEAIESDVPPQLWDIRSYRITLGGAPAPRDPLPDLSTRPAGQSVPGPLPAARHEGPALGWPAPGRPDSGEGPSTEGPRPYEEQTLARPSLEGPGAPGPAGEAPKPWLPLVIASAAAFACFGGMLYTGWIAWDYRRRYRQLFEEMIAAGVKAEA